MDRDERAQHLLAHSKLVPKPKKKRVRPGRQKAAKDTPEVRRAAFEIVSAAMDEVGAFMIADSAVLTYYIDLGTTTHGLSFVWASLQYEPRRVDLCDS